MDSAWAIIPHGTPEVPCSRHLQPLVFGVDAGWSLPPSGQRLVFLLQIFLFARQCNGVQLPELCVFWPFL